MITLGNVQNKYYYRYRSFIFIMFRLNWSFISQILKISTEAFNIQPYCSINVSWCILGIHTCKSSFKLTTHYRFQGGEHCLAYRNGKMMDFYTLSIISVSITYFSLERPKFTVIGMMTRMEVNELSPQILKAQQNASKVLIVMTLIQKPCKWQSPSIDC